MISYRLYVRDGRSSPDAAIASNGSKSFVFDIGNPDYRQFKSDLQSGAALNDVNGMAMTDPQVTAFLASIP